MIRFMLVRLMVMVILFQGVFLSDNVCDFVYLWKSLYFFLKMENMTTAQSTKMD